MIKKIIYKIFRHRHFWRNASFDELSQIYISTFFRMMAISIVGVFVPIFLYDLGYSLAAIFGFYVSYFVARTILHIPAGYTVARMGPKHTMIISYGLQLVFSVLLLTLPEYGWWLWVIASLWATANNLFFTAYHVDFSKVKHSEHSGKEMGFANIIQHVGGVIGPIIGGVVATVFGPQYIFLAMMLFLIVGVIPLLSTAEPVKQRQKIRFRNIPLSSIRRDLISYAGLTVTHQVSVTLWPLYISLYALGANVYLELGALSSVGFIVSIFTAFAIGKIVDRRKGRELLHLTAITDMFLQFAKPFVNSLPFALVVNTAGESTNVSMRIAYQKGMYDAADDLPGNRIVYISIMETFGALVKSVLWIVLLCIGLYVGFEIAIVIGFMLAGLANLLTITEKFKGL